MSQHSADGKAWDAQRKRVLDRDGWCCRYCTKVLVGDDATVDHIEPIALTPGRVYRDDELCAACRSCNSRKKDQRLVRLDYRSPVWFLQTVG